MLQLPSYIGGHRRTHTRGPSVEPHQNLLLRNHQHPEYQTHCNILSQRILTSKNVAPENLSNPLSLSYLVGKYRVNNVPELMRQRDIWVQSLPLLSSMAVPSPHSLSLGGKGGQESDLNHLLGPKARYFFLRVLWISQLFLQIPYFPHLEHSLSGVLSIRLVLKRRTIRWAVCFASSN